MGVKERRKEKEKSKTESEPESTKTQTKNLVASSKRLQKIIELVEGEVIGVKKVKE